MGKNIVELTGVNKIYGTNHVVKDLTLTVEEGEFLTLLGSSGCGKTTTLRMIAGFEEPTTGSIKVEGEAIEEKEPYERDVNTVFQSYALFPHKTIYDNIAYGLKMKKVPKKEIAERVKEMMELVQLEGFEKRYPNQLSGGQKQRVAIARALINRPKVLLLDEPLGALDLKLRKQMQLELKRLQKKLNITFIYVTHDQEEALTMSDRIAIMHDVSWIRLQHLPRYMNIRRPNLSQHSLVRPIFLKEWPRLWTVIPSQSELRTVILPDAVQILPPVNL